MISIPYFTYKDIRSLDLGVYIQDKGTYNAPERDVIYTSVPGRSGDLITDNGRFKNISISYDLLLVRNKDKSFEECVSEVKEWLLSESGYYELSDTYDTRYFRYASFVGGIDIAEDLEDIGEFTAVFNCKPLRYSFEGQNTITITQKDQKIINPEAFGSKPYIKIYGSGSISLHINNKTYSFTGVSEYIEIDSEIMNAYKGTALQNSKMISEDFPVFVPGENTISYTGTVSKIEIIPRWCTI